MQEGLIQKGDQDRVATQDGAGALSILATPFITQNLRRIVHLTLEHRLPAIFWMKQFAEAGSLMAYGPSQRDLYRRTAISRREKPFGSSKTMAWTRPRGMCKRRKACSRRRP